MSKQEWNEFTERFAREVATHVMTVERNEGLDRRLTFRRPGTRCMSFEIVTWPGILAYTGDMGSFMFTRLTDMFEFFRLPQYPARLPDFGYWEEKCIAADRSDGTRRFAPALFEQNVREWITRTCDELSPREARDLWRVVEEAVIRRADDGAQEAIRAACEFEWKGRHPLQDFWEMRCEEHTYRFTWACHAIAWGIQCFDSIGRPVVGEVA